MNRIKFDVCLARAKECLEGLSVGDAVGEALSYQSFHFVSNVLNIAL